MRGHVGKITRLLNCVCVHASSKRDYMPVSAYLWVGVYVCVVSLGGMWACADFLLYCGWASVSAVPGSKRHRSSFKCHNPTILLAFRFSPGLSLCCLSFCLFAGKTFLPRRSTWSWARRQKEKELRKKYRKSWVCRRGMLCPTETGSSASVDMNGGTEGRARGDGNGPVETMMSWLVRCDHPAVTLAPHGRHWKAHTYSTHKISLCLPPNRSQLLQETMRPLSLLTSILCTQTHTHAVRAQQMSIKTFGCFKCRWSVTLVDKII